MLSKLFMLIRRCWNGISNTLSRSCVVTIYTVNTALFLSILWEWSQLHSFTIDFDFSLIYSWTVWHSCWTGHCPLKADLRPTDPRLRLGYLHVGELHLWHLCHFCMALDLTVQFRLLSGIHAWPHIWIHFQLGSSGPHCSKFADDQHC